MDTLQLPLMTLWYPKPLKFSGDSGQRVQNPTHTVASLLGRETEKCWQQKKQEESTNWHLNKLCCSVAFVFAGATAGQKHVLAWVSPNHWKVFVYWILTTGWALYWVFAIRSPRSPSSCKWALSARRGSIQRYADVLKEVEFRWWSRKSYPQETTLEWGLEIAEKAPQWERSGAHRYPGAVGSAGARVWVLEMCGWSRGGHV